MDVLLLLAVEVSPTPGFTNPIKMSEGLLNFFTFINQVPLLGTLLILIGLDIMSGLALSLYQKQLSSVISWRGMCRKVFMLLIVAGCAVIEPFTHGIPVAKLGALCFIYTEMISVLENAALAGVPLPTALVSTLRKLRETEKSMVPLPVASIQVNAEILKPVRKQKKNT